MSGFGELPCLMLRCEFLILSNIYCEAFCENNYRILTINYFCTIIEVWQGLQCLHYIRVESSWLKLFIRSSTFGERPGQHRPRTSYSFPLCLLLGIGSLVSRLSLAEQNIFPSFQQLLWQYPGSENFGLLNASAFILMLKIAMHVYRMSVLKPFLIILW